MDVDACAVLENNVISTRRLGQRENRKLPIVARLHVVMKSTDSTISPSLSPLSFCISIQFSVLQFLFFLLILLSSQDIQSLFQMFISHLLHFFKLLGESVPLGCCFLGHDLDGFQELLAVGGDSFSPAPLRERQTIDG